MRSQLAFLDPPPPDQFIPIWDVAVSRLGMLALVRDFYVRPAPRGDTFHSRDFGRPFIVPSDQRLVPVEGDRAAHICEATKLRLMAAHLYAAMQLRFPQPQFETVWPADLVAAIRLSLRLGDGIGEWRAARAAELSAIAESLQPFSTWLRSLSPPHARLLPETNLAFTAALAEAMVWPHTRLLESLVHGFAFTGDIPDTGLFRPVDRPASLPPSTLSPAANIEFNLRLARLVQSQATSPVNARIQAELECATHKEVSSGLVRGPLTSNQMDEKFGRGRWRSSHRFGVEQGSGDSWKVRPIDNFKGNLVNACAATHETIHCITFEWVAFVVHIARQLCTELGIPLPPALLGLDDEQSAYRFILNCAPWLMAFAAYSTERSRVEHYWLPGHVFGAVAAVLNYNSWSEFQVAIARVYLAVICGHYFDDFPTLHFGSPPPPDPARPAGKRRRYAPPPPSLDGQGGLATTHRLTGAILAAKKHIWFDTSNVLLGVRANLALAHSHFIVMFEASPGRVDKILLMLRDARRHHSLPSHTAGVIRGKLGFILTHAYGRVGRAAAQPLVQREFFDSTDEFTLSLQHMHDFFEALLPVLPPLAVSVLPDEKPPLIVYSDASYHLDSAGLHRAEVAFLVCDPARPSDAWFASDVIPQSYFSHFTPGLSTYVNQAEATALAACPFSLPDVFRGRSFIHFVDNTAALSLFVHGYSSRPDCALLVNQYYIIGASLRFRPYFEWVPSEANIADLPSRGKVTAMLAIIPHARRVPLVYPRMFHGECDLVQFARSVGLT